MATHNVNATAATTAPIPSEKQEKKEFLQRPKNKVSNSIPKPKALSSNETPLTNDPLWKESFMIDGETGFTNELSTKEFEADAAGYVSIIEQEYKAITDVDKQYAKSIPASAHAYYHGVVYWYKLAFHAQKNGIASLEQDRLVRFVDGYPSSLIASGAGEYLTGLGDFQDSTGVKHRLHSSEPNQHGHFGRVTAQTHALYETLPAPAILLQRVVEDIHATRQRGGEDLWIVDGIAPLAPRQVAQDDPDEQEPDERAVRNARRRHAEVGEGEDDEGGNAQDDDRREEAVANRPTVNLLGWRRARALTANQQNEMSEVMDPDEPFGGLVNQRYAIRREFFELVGRRLRECKRYKMVPIPKTTVGSLVQQVVWRPAESVTTTTQQAIEAPGHATSRTLLPLRVAIAAKIMCYKTLRREIEDDDGTIRNSWSCYSFNSYREVPANWAANRNTLAQRGFDGLISYAPFKTYLTPRTDTLIEYLNKYNKKKLTWVVSFYVGI